MIKTLYWRRGRDLNPRESYITLHSLSRRAPSTTRPPLQRREWDLNPRGPLRGLAIFKTAAFDRSAIPPDVRLGHSHEANPTSSAEGEGFEPSRRYNPLRHFECRALGQPMRSLQE